jgi:hypothetical protein
MKTNPAFAALLCATLTVPCFADTFTLKDGTTLEAKVLSETPDTYDLEVQVTKSIKDERKIAKADVAKVSRDQPDLKAFEAVGALVPTPDFQTDDDYLTKIRVAEKFLKDYPSSTKVKDAKAIIATLKGEATQIAAGGVKASGKIVTASEYQANAYDLDARVQEMKIRDLIAANDYIGALRLFSDFDRDYRNTLSYGSLSATIKQLIQSQVAESKQALAALPAKIKERDLGLQRMSSEDRPATQEAIKEEAVAVEARYKAEKDAKQVWVTTSPFHKASLEDTVKFGETELARLSTVKPILGVDGGKSYREVYAAVNNGGNLAAVNAAMNAAKTALVPARYLAPLEAASKGRK